MNNGYIKLHRKILDNPIVMKDTECLAVWIYLLLNATHKEKSVMFKGKRVTLKPGQLITGIISISKKMKINKDKVQRTLKLFENDKQIEQQTSNKNRLITIVNWDLYQNFDKQNDKQVINNCETTDKQVITNNNDKNERNIYSTTSTKNERIDACVCDDEDSISGRYGNKRNGDENLFEFVERHFGRTLSGAEYEHIEIWEDNELTRYAVKEAVLSGARSIKYVEKILERYKRENFKTVEDVQNSRNKFKKTSQLSQEEQEIFKEMYGDMYMKHYKKIVENPYTKKPETKIVNAYAEIDVALPEAHLVFLKDNGIFEGTDSCKHAFKVIHYQLGIQGRFHDFRDTHATRLIEAGADIKAVSKRLGHSTVEFTYNIYVRVTTKMEEEIVNKFEEYLAA